MTDLQARVVLPSEPPAEYPRLRSFHPRQRGLSPSRAAQFETLRARHCLPSEGRLLDLDALFGGLPVVLDIGFGGGEGLIAMANQRPDQAIIGAEVHTPGVAAVLDAIDANAWGHVRVVHGDVLDMTHRIPQRSLAGLRIWFPDPWPRTRQRKRRIVRSGVFDELVDLLRADAEVHLATDHADYARQIIDVCARNDRLRGGVVARPEWRPLTRYEQRGIDAGRQPVDFVYRTVT